MNDEISEFYVSLIRNDKEIVGHTISFNPPTKEDDLTQRTEKAPEIKTANPTEASHPTFSGVCANFVSVMDSYRKFIPLTLQVAPVLSAAIARKQIGDFVRSKGIERNDLSHEKVEVYQLDISRYREFSVYNDEVLAAIEGARHLPEVMLIGLISVYDAFLSQLLKVVLNLHEEIVLTSEKAILFSDLSKFSSIQEARSSLIDREIEAVIRQSHHDQFSWMEQRLGIKLRDNLQVWPAFVEACERRNLVTHTGGLVTAQYLQNCRSHGVDVSNARVGQKLKIDSRYFSLAVASIYEVGAKLCHVFWRKFSKDQREQADSALVDLGYNLIFVRAYALAEALMRFGVDTIKQHATEKARRMMVVNLANAVRLQGRDEEAKKILEQYDWSAVGLDFQVCVAAVRSDIDGVVGLMTTIGKGGPPSAEEYRTWPVFRGMRTKEKFKSAFELIFEEPLIFQKTIGLPQVPERNDELLADGQPLLSQTSN